MKRSDLNHLRRLVAWARCEIGQSPDELVTTDAQSGRTRHNELSSPAAEGSPSGARG